MNDEAGARPLDEFVAEVRYLNRLQRRKAVAEFRAQIMSLPKAVPMRNPTIIPKTQRRRHKS